LHFQLQPPAAAVYGGHVGLDRVERKRFVQVVHGPRGLAGSVVGGAQAVVHLRELQQVPDRAGRVDGGCVISDRLGPRSSDYKHVGQMAEDARLAFHGERLRIFEQPPCARFPIERLYRKPLVLLLLEVLPRLRQARKRLERLNEPAASLAHVEADEGQVPGAWPFSSKGLPSATTASKSR
jgi:hypothetical protein